MYKKGLPLGAFKVVLIKNLRADDSVSQRSTLKSYLLTLHWTRLDLMWFGIHPEIGLIADDVQ